jgi:hypothetical protein
MENIFTKHPKEVGESYIHHLWAALRFSLILLGLFFIAFIHSIFPFIFKQTVSNKIIKMADQLKTRQ